MIFEWSAVFLLLCVFVNAKEKAKGASCTLPNKKPGICQSFKDCPDAKDQREIRAEICGFEGRYPIICCKIPNMADKLNAPTKSEEFCAKHHKPVVPREPNANVPFVYGGWKSLAAEFPHMAILGYGKKEDIKWGCGGSLISFRHILTAAHCLNSRELGDVQFVRVGDLNLTSTTDMAEPQDFTVVKRIKHSDYRLPSKYHDIAILELDRDIKMTIYVRPACLQVNKNIDSKWLQATGWGRLEFGGETADHLQVVDLQKTSNERCNEDYKTEKKSKLSQGIVDKWQICAAKEFADTCQGDSGGPIQISNQKFVNCWQVVGVTSFGKACGVSNAPGVYTRVSNYIEWIESIVWP